MSIRAIFGKNVRAAREARGWSQAELAEKIGRAVNTVGRLERGEVNVSLKAVDKLAEVLDVHPTALFGAEPPVAPTPERQKALTRLQVKLTRCTDDQLAAAEKAVRIVLE